MIKKIYIKEHSQASDSADQNRATPLYNRGKWNK